LAEEDLELFGEYIRQAILRVLALIWSGKKERDKLNDLLDKGVLDESVRENLLIDPDFETMLVKLV
jgi:hypothetical protein